MRTLPYAKLFLCASLGAVFFAAYPTQAQSLLSPRITQPVDDASRVTLKGTVHPLANAKNDTGPASPDLRVDRVQLVLKRSAQQESALQQLIGDMHTPGSASYHKWLTPTQFGQQFGPADQDIQTIENWVRSRGFDVGRLNPGNGTLEISGTVGQLEDTFHTSIHRYLVAGQLHYANAIDPQIPAALAPVLGGFVSLNNFPVRRLSRLLGKASYDPTTHHAAPQWTVASDNGLGYDLVVAPQDFYVQYDLNPLYSAGTNGSGQAIAIINDSNININFANNFRTLFGLPANPPQVIIDGSDPGIDGINNPDGPNYDSIEAYLDVEWSGAVAPDANIDLVIAGDTAVENGLILAAEHAIYSDIAPVMSVSFGACEQTLGSDNQFLSSLWQQAAAEGITVLVASGDSGSAGTDPNTQSPVCDDSSEPAAQFGLAVSGYASTPYDVAVGGTDFYYSDIKQNPSQLLTQIQTDWNTAPSASPKASLNASLPEQPWNDTLLGINFFQQVTPEIVGGGGGASTCGMPTTDPNSGATIACAPYPKPSWQTGAGVPNDNVRDLPDVALFAADGINDSYYPVCAADGDCQSGSTPVQISGVGGTSGAAPAMAGIMALVNQKYGAQGQADYVLYPLAKQHPTAFHDVTVGTNAMPCVTNSPTCSAGALSGYAATVGYDPASGLGSVDANQLVTNWNSISFTASTTTLTLSSTSFTHGTAVTLNASVTASGGTPTGNVAVLTDSPTNNQQAQTNLTLKSGSASGSVNFLPGGTYHVWGQYGGDGGFGASASSKTQVTVTPESSSIIFNAVVSSQSGFQTVASQQVPYGTQIILDGDVVPTSYYNSCNGGNSSSTSCQNAVFAFSTGTVAFTDGSSTINTAVINSEGDAEYITGALPVGSHSVAAKYSGDPSYNASTATAVTFSVVKASPGVTVISNVSPIAAGQALVLTAVVDSGGLGTAPTGTVTFKNGGTTLGSAVNLVSGVNPSTGTTIGIATLSVPPPLTPGAESIVATYGGDGNYSSAGSAPTSLSVGAASGLLGSTVTATASPSTASPTSAVTLSATVTGQAGHAAPTGTIDFQTSGTDRGTFQITPSKTSDTSTFAFTLNSQILFQGANVVTLQYSGDANYQASSFTLTINNPLADFSMIAQNPVVTVASGGSTTATVSFTSLNGFNAAVALACAGPSGITCSVSPASVTVNGTASATLTVNAATTKTGSNRQQPLGWFWAGGGVTFACVFLFGLPQRRRGWQTFLGLIVIAILTVGIGCGGGGGGSSSSSGSGSGSNPGNGNGSGNGNSAITSSTVVLTGTQGAISHNVAIIVKVQGS